MKRLLFFFFVFFVIPAAVFCQEGAENEAPSEEVIDEADELDDLFSNPDADVVVEEEQEQVEHRETFEKSEKITVKGNFKATGLIGAGWTSWDFITDPVQDFDGYAGLSSTASITFDARPAPEVRVFGNFYAAYNPVDEEDVLMDFEDLLNSVIIQEGSWDGPSIKELYCDYILNDFLYTRLGKHSISWGQGRLFKPGNILADSLNSFNFRVTIPTFSGLTFVVLTNNGTSYRDLVYAAKADLVFGDTLISPALRYNWNEGFTGLLSLKQVLFGTDFLLDARARYTDRFTSVYAVAGFFREWEDLKLYGEYQFSWKSEDVAYTNDAAIAAGLDNPFGAPFDLGVKWQHNFMDSSGTVTLGLNQNLWPYVTMKLGLPVVYGAEGSSAVEAATHRISFNFGLTLSVGF